MDIFAQLVKKIITKQENVIGPLAWEQARQVPGLTINPQNSEVGLEGNKSEIVENLVEKYKELFGQASVEVCKDASKDLITKIPQEQRPKLLQ